jgi:ankyrin repeat protein
MKNERLGQRMQPLVSLLLSAGADPAVCGSRGKSAISLLFDTAGGLAYLQSFLWRCIDLIQFQQMSSLDNWIIAAVARSVPEFHCRLTAELEDFHTPAAISSHRSRKPPSLPQLDIFHQISEIRNADAQTRETFVRLLCRRGTAQILEPLLQQGVDANEAGNGELSYLGEAAQSGNRETFAVLLNAGSNINDGVIYSPLDALLERWAVSMRRGELDETMKKEAEMFEQLKRTPQIASEDAVYRTIYLRNEYCMTRLLELGFGRRQGQPRGPSHLSQLYGCEAFSAVKGGYLRGLQLLVDYGVGLDFEDQEGYTALQHALDKGFVEFVKVFIEGGAKHLQRTSAGLTALEVARKNLAAPHPRTPTFVGAYVYLDNVKSVTYDDDLKAFLLLQDHLRDDRADLTLPPVIGK